LEFPNLKFVKDLDFDLPKGKLFAKLEKIEVSAEKE